MAPLPILTYPDPRLKQPAEPVERFDAELCALVAALEQTMRAGPAAVGIAAPQVGVLRCVVLLDVSGRKKAQGHGRVVLVNPEILAWEGMAIGREGCLSVPDFTGNVIRAERVTVQSCDEHGTPQRHEMVGFEARAAQHEIDHLEGVLFLDRLVSRRHDLVARRAARSERTPA
jgi:peptide deformylase